MNRTKLRPTNSLDGAKSLARLGKMIVNGRVRRHLMNQFGYLDIDHFLASLFDYLKPDDFSKSIALDMDGHFMMFSQMSTCAEALNTRIGTLSFQLIPRAMRI